MTIFGYNFTKQHYYKKSTYVNGKKNWMKGKSFVARHKWSYEKRCLMGLKSGILPRVTVM